MSNLSLLPEVVNIQLVHGTDNSIEFTLTDEGVAVDITNDTVTLVIKTNYGGTTKFSGSNGPGAHSSPLLGKTRFVLPRASMALTTPSSPETWVYQLRRIVAVTNDQLVYMSGNVVLSPGF